MGLSRWIIVALLILFFAVVLLRLLRSPLRLILRLAYNTLLGFGALWIVHFAAPFSGISLGFNLWNALTVGVLGGPGLALLLLVQWVL